MKAVPDSDNTIPLVKKNTVSEILGVVTTEGAVHTGRKGSENNTRWVFDVETTEAGSIDIQLLDLRGRPAVADIEPSFHFTPLSGQFYGARVCGETKKTLLTLRFEGACKFRVDVDIIGTNRR